MTPLMNDFYYYLIDKIAENGQVPSYRQMATDLKLSSTSCVARLVDALVERGRIEKLPNRSRSIRLLDTPEMRFIREKGLEKEFRQWRDM